MSGRLLLRQPIAADIEATLMKDIYMPFRIIYVQHRQFNILWKRNIIKTKTNQANKNLL